MKTALLPTALFALAATAATARADVRDSVVKVHSSQRAPDFLRPWTKQAVRELSGTGVVLPGGRILTNAHVVNYASQVYVQPYQSSDKLRANVRALGVGIDLALLELAQPDDFFEKHPPLPMSEELPEVRRPVSVYGFPVGGSDLSITEGIVSRIEYAPYDFGTSGLRIQVDAALNPGNSGGPAVSGDHMVGVVFSGIPEAENIGFLIPVEEVQDFLQDVEDGTWDGHPYAFDSFQTLENDALRARLGAPREVSGLVVTDPLIEGADYPLHPWDVLTHIGEHDIGNDGQVLVRENLRLSFRYLVPKLASDGKVPVRVFREGQEVALELPVRRRLDLLMPFLDDEYPPYFIYGPLVFSSANQSFARGLISMGAGQMLIDRASPLIRRTMDMRASADEELVIVPSRLFPHPITKGYDEPLFATLRSVNGIEIQSLRHLIETLRDLEDEFVVFVFHDKHQEHLVFRRTEIEAATEEILTDSGIRHRASEDLLTLWPD
jgi:S1-C subfamily serine protease